MNVGTFICGGEEYVVLSSGKIISSRKTIVFVDFRQRILDYFTLVLSAQRATTNNYLLGPSDWDIERDYVTTKQVYGPREIATD